MAKKDNNIIQFPGPKIDPDSKKDAENIAKNILDTIGIDNITSDYQKTYQDLVEIVISGLQVLDNPLDIRVNFRTMEADEKILLEDGWHTVRENTGESIKTDKGLELEYDEEALELTLDQVQAIAIFPPDKKAGESALDLAA